MTAYSDYDLIEHQFTYHAPTAEQVVRLRKVREAGRHLAVTIIANTQESADQSAALRKVREAVMTANAAIVLEQQS